MKDEQNTQLMPMGDTIDQTQKAPAPHQQAGFTLIEIMMVIAAIGVLMYILLPGLSGGGSRQDALLMERVANTANSQFEMINMSCGTSMRIASNNITNDQDSDSLGDMLFFGDINEDYIRCYERSGVTPSSRDVTVRDGDKYLVDTDFPISFEDQARAAGGARAFVVVFEDVDRDTAEALAQRFDEDVDLNAFSGNYPDTAGDRAPLNITGTNNSDNLTVKFRYIW